jgi:hypothetical protein
MNHFQDFHFLQEKVVAGNSNSPPSGCSDLVVFQEDVQPIVVVERGKVFCEVAEMEGEASSGRVSPLNTYSPSEGDLSGYSDWVIQCANEIFPIVGISYEGHKLQLLDFLAFLEEERRIDEVGALSSGGMKGKREVKKLECYLTTMLEVLALDVGKGRRGVIQLCREA